MDTRVWTTVMVTKGIIMARVLGTAWFGLFSMTSTAVWSKQAAIMINTWAWHSVPKHRAANGEEKLE
jgi:hypothetical protein